MIANTKTAHWAIHIAVLQAVTAALYRAHTASLKPEELKPLNDAIVTAAKAATTELGAFLLRIPNSPQAGVTGREIINDSDQVIAETMAELAAPAGDK